MATILPYRPYSACESRRRFIHGTTASLGCASRFRPRPHALLIVYGLSFHFYADDSPLYTSFACNHTSDLVAAKQRLENCVADINLWMTANKLKLNNDKSEFLFLHSHFRHSLPPPTISVDMESIRPSQQARNLGVIFDNTMSLSPHVNTIVKGAFYHLRNISKIRKYISKSSSKLDFCNSLLFGAQKQDIVKLLSPQNAAA